MGTFIHRLDVKFVLLTTTVIILGAIVINYKIYMYEYNEHSEMAQHRALVIASTISDVIWSRINDTMIDSNDTQQIDLTDFMERFSMKQNYVRSVTIFDHNLGPISTYGIPMTESSQHLSTFLEGASTIILDSFYQNEKIIKVYEPIRLAQGRMGLLAMMISSEVERMGMNQLLRNLVWITIVVIVISVLLAIVVARIMAQPIKVLGQEMELIEPPDFKTLLKKDRKDELGILQERFLLMLERLRRSEKEKEKARDALIQAEKMASVGTLAAGIAHEINNPLAGLKQSIHRIEVNPENIAQTKKYITMIHDALTHIENVVKGLLDFSRKRELSLKEIDINGVVEDAIRMLEYQFKGNKIKCNKRLNPNLNTILGDAYYLEQVFVNLLINAVDAMPSGGNLTVSSLSDDKQVLIEIRDTGSGIEKSQLDYVFDPFFTTKEEGKGTGLGLSICYSIIKEHRGNITIESKVGIGTKVAVTIPYV